MHREAAHAHVPGKRENVFVARGVVEIVVGDDRPITLGEGDALLFEADTPHSYRNLVASETVLYLVTGGAELV